MTSAELKASILDRAVHGLLVPQDPNDEPAAKPSLIDNPPYELPRGWVWKRLGDIVTLSFSGRSPKYSKIPNKNLTLGQRNNQDYGIDFSGIKYSTDEFVSTYPEEMYLRDYDILLNTLGGGTVGRVGVFKGDPHNRYITDGHLFVFRFSASVTAYYIYYWFVTMRKQIELDADGSTNQIFLKLPKINNYPIPLPPLAEQKRIVAKIEELMPLVEEYGKAEAELAALNDNFPTALRKSILQHAVEGRLTAAWRRANPRGETAAELLAKIAAEKKHLLAEGKIKKQKPLPPITNDEKPFPTPDGWEWARIGDIAKVISKGTTPSGGATAYVSQGITFIRSENITSNHTLELSQAKRITKAVHENELSRSILESGDLLVCIAGSLGKVGYVRQQDLPANTNQAVCFTRLNHNAKACLPYLVHLLSSESMQRSMLVQKKNTGVPNLTLEIIANLPIPLPPLAEQKAIVERVEELLALVEKMK